MHNRVVKSQSWLSTTQSRPNPASALLTPAGPTQLLTNPSDGRSMVDEMDDPWQSTVDHPSQDPADSLWIGSGEANPRTRAWSQRGVAAPNDFTLMDYYDEPPLKSDKRAKRKGNQLVNQI